MTRGGGLSCSPRGGVRGESQRCPYAQAGVNGLANRLTRARSARHSTEQASGEPGAIRVVRSTTIKQTPKEDISRSNQADTSESTLHARLFGTLLGQNPRPTLPTLSRWPSNLLFIPESMWTMDLRYPIERRMEPLTEGWLAFTDQELARLLIWRVKPDDRPLLDAFLCREQEETGQIPDLFLRFEVPFRQASTYAAHLLEVLRSGASEMEEGWVCPPPSTNGDGVETFVQACVSLRRKYGEMMDYLAVVITPDEVLDPLGWQAWLVSLLQAVGMDEGVRLLVVDDPTSPLLAALMTTTSPLVVVSDLELTLPLAMEEIAHAANNGSPEGRFRELVAGISRASSEGMESEAWDMAQAALHLARAERWLDMECVVHAILGGMFLSLRQPERAVESYRGMGAVAEQLTPDDPARGAMLLQARLSEGSVHFGEDSYGQAAECYEAAGASAQDIGNTIAQVDAWRMAGVCRELLHQEDQAVECLWRALEAGKSLASDQRRHSMLPHAGAKLLALTEAPTRLHQRPTVEDHLAFLFGPQWRDELLGEGQT